MQALPDLAFRTLLSQVTRLAFSQRRKKMIKQLSSVFGKETVLEGYGLCGIAEDIRAERVSIGQFMELTRFFQRKNSSEN